jgi:hypothetical protein
MNNIDEIILVSKIIEKLNKLDKNWTNKINFINLYYNQYCDNNKIIKNLRKINKKYTYFVFKFKAVYRYQFKLERLLKIYNDKINKGGSYEIND